MWVVKKHRRREDVQNLGDFGGGSKLASSSVVQLRMKMTEMLWHLNASFSPRKTSGYTQLT